MGMGLKALGLQQAISFLATHLVYIGNLCINLFICSIKLFTISLEYGVHVL